MVGIRSNETFRIRKSIPPAALLVSQVVEETIADFVKPVRKAYRGLLKRVLGGNFQNRRYRVVGIIEPIQFDIRAG